MQTKIALVTGGTSGVGRSILPDLVRAGFFVHFIGTNAAKGRAVEAELNAGGEAVARFIKLDLSDLRGVGAFAQQFAEDVPTLDLLLNVAGVLLQDRQVTEEGFEKTFSVGYLSAFLLSRELTPSLARAPHPRIANVAGAPKFVLTQALNLDDLDFETDYKPMLVAIKTVHAKTVLTEILAEKLSEHGIDVNSFHPGAVKGDLGRSMGFPLKHIFAVANKFMSATSKSGVYVSTAEELNGVTGQFFVGKKPRPLSFDQAYKDELWKQTESMLERVA
ncbi:MAG: SDR family NAD(P)-dependent oxidoreductase [Deltaproteobacteria bacterium]|nr:SDR family NAD(P)-dependent oxidoreductase [Deltaproteobacteria bacterium]